MTHRAHRHQCAAGNIQRLILLPGSARLEKAEQQLDNLRASMAQAELGAVSQEAELAERVRLAELDALLNMDDRNDDPDCEKQRKSCLYWQIRVIKSCHFVMIDDEEGTGERSGTLINVRVNLEELARIRESRRNWVFGIPVPI